MESSLSPEKAGLAASPAGFNEQSFPKLFRSALEKQGLVELFKKVLRKEKLDQEEILSLAKARLPLLGKLLELFDPLPKTLYIRSSTLEESENNFFHFLPESLAQFVKELLGLRESKLGKNPDLTWIASLEEPLDSFDLNSKKPLGLNVLTYIALARIVLGKSCNICAPLNLLGQNLALLAINYGANDLGFIAPEKQNDLLKELLSHAHLELTINCL